MITLSEIAGSLFKVCKDSAIVTNNNSTTYLNEVNSKNKEPKSKTKKIKFITPASLKKYKQYFNSHKDKEIFSNNCKTYNISNISDENILENIVKNQEIYGLKYGITHDSKFTKMLIDPIGEANGYTNNDIYPYERSVPSDGKEGIVLIAKYNSKFIILNQERHAIRDRQYAFVRGFGENISNVENAKKEATEELSIKNEDISNIQHLGHITPDSGASSNTTQIYYAELTNFNSANINHEGIKEYKLCTIEEIGQMIKDKIITDSFTICAFTLYKLQFQHSI